MVCAVDDNELIARVRAAVSGADFTPYRSHPWLQCESASMAIVEHLAEIAVPAEIVEFHAEHESHCVATVDGIVVDVTFGQFDTDAEWPLIEPVGRYRHRFRSGPDQVDLVARWDDAGLDVEGLTDRHRAIGYLAEPDEPDEHLLAALSSHSRLYHPTADPESLDGGLRVQVDDTGLGTVALFSAAAVPTPTAGATVLAVDLERLDPRRLVGTARGFAATGRVDHVGPIPHEWLDGSTSSVGN
jgi:hypothetical protein